jgi:predicted DNA-binding transcriptional regulator YafY
MSVRQHYERYYWFDAGIKAGRYPNTRHLVEEFEISQRTAYRTIEDMRIRFNAPLKYDHHKRGYFYTDNAFFLPNQWVNESTIMALSLAIRLATAIPEPALKDDLCRLIERLTVFSENKSANTCFARIEELVSIKNIEYTLANTTIFRKTIEALFAGRTINITYYSPHTAKTTVRSIHPLHLMHYMGNWHLIAWCGTRMELRNFALSRISKIIPASDNLHLPDTLPELKGYTRQHFGIMQGETSTNVGLRFSPKISPWVSEQIWHPQQQATLNPDHSLTLHFPVADFRELVKTILSHGADIEVLEPSELKILVKEEIDKMTKIYRHYDTS